MKHIKLFENWAEENVELPEYLDPDVHEIEEYSKTIFHPDILKHIRNDYDLRFLDYTENQMKDGEDDFSVEMRSFSDYNVWEKSGYTSIHINQELCYYTLKDCFGIPNCSSLVITHTQIKSLRGLENRNFSNKFTVTYSKLENLKYCPTSTFFNFECNPLLSYYGVESDGIENWSSLACINECLHSGIINPSWDPDLDQLNDPHFCGELFSYLKNKIYHQSSNLPTVHSWNPWNLIYDDPNEVENYEFLFVPFYTNSERFKENAKKYIENLDLSGVTIGRTDLW